MTDLQDALRCLPSSQGTPCAAELEARLLEFGFRAELPTYGFADAFAEEIGLAICGARAEIVLVTLDAGSRDADAFVSLTVDRVAVVHEVASDGANGQTFLLEGRLVSEQDVTCFSRNEAYAAATPELVRAATRRVIAYCWRSGEYTVLAGVYQVLDPA